jgi:secreted trypsin-like serine protease
MFGARFTGTETGDRPPYGRRVPVLMSASGRAEISAYRPGLHQTRLPSATMAATAAIYQGGSPATSLAERVLRALSGSDSMVTLAIAIGKSHFGE